jgi:hypothetical protein
MSIEANAARSEPGAGGQPSSAEHRAAGHGRTALSAVGLTLILGQRVRPSRSL